MLIDYNDSVPSETSTIRLTAFPPPPPTPTTLIRHGDPEPSATIWLHNLDSTLRCCCLINLDEEGITEYAHEGDKSKQNTSDSSNLNVPPPFLGNE